DYYCYSADSSGNDLF
nr:immunoglobulin light chain junction region [Macaca mulatta]